MHHQDKTLTKNRTASVPLLVLTVRLFHVIHFQDDILIESMLSHHQDVYDSLEKRTWVRFDPFYMGPHV